MSMIIRVLVLLLLLSPCAQADVYTTSQVNAAQLLEDNEIDSLAQGNNRGTLGALNLGGKAFSPPQFSVLINDISLQDSVGSGATMLACTLWVQVVTKFDGNDDYVELSVHNVHRPNIENQATWDDSATGDPWNMDAPGTDFTVSVASAIKCIRQQADSFLWIDLVNTDTTFVKFTDGSMLPIPLTVGHADSLLAGTSFGVRIHSENGNSGGFNAAAMKIGATENVNAGAQPFFKYVYTPGAAIHTKVITVNIN